jgi:hypothetical protein
MSLGRLLASVNDFYPYWCESTSIYGDGGLGASIAAGSLDSYEIDFSSTWCAPTSTFGLGAYGTPGLANDVCDVPLSLDQMQVGDLVVSEIMHTPSAAADTMGEWFEIYNTTDSDFILTGLQVSSESGEGFSVTEEVVIEAGGYFVFAVRSSPTENGGISNVGFRYYVNVFRLYSTDTIILKKSDDTIIDSVSFDAIDYSVSSGTSLNLGVLDATSNDDSSSWCAPTLSFGDGDLGTPGESNDTCQ